MQIREAKIADIPQIMKIRFAVKENRLTDPTVVSEKDCEIFLVERGKGWVCEVNELVVGFSIIDLIEKNIWALFILPDFEGKGIGKKLHDKMINWYFANHQETLWLSTDPNTRAELFYQKKGWQKKGICENGEIKFELTYKKWNKG